MVAKGLIAVLLLLVLARGFILNRNTPCPAPSPCRCYGRTVDCVSDHLTTVPVLNFTVAVHWELNINLQNNRITTVGSRALGNIDIVQNDVLTVNLDNNDINHIDENAFDNVGNSSVSIYLSNNNLSSIPKALLHIRNLKALHLLGNSILYLDSSILTSIGRSLESLWLDSGALAVWPRSFSSLTSLTELILEYVPFTSLPESAFDGLVALERLEIRYSKLTAVPKAICSLDELQIFHFEHNDNVDIAGEVLPHCDNPLSNVVGLYLSYNNLLTFSIRDIENFPGLRTLALDFNLLSDLGSASSTSIHIPLYSLYLTYNKLTSIPSVVSNMPELLTLVVSQNAISSINSVTLSGLQKLRQLTLSEAPLTVIDPHAFSTSYAMKSLYLERTNLTSIPAAVMHLADQYNADFTGSPIECTCRNLAFLREIPLNDFVDGRKHLRGNCVNTDPVVSIQDFVIGMTNTCS